MKISIIISTYNAQAYIQETLSSINQQTYPNYEIVIVDDGSTDSTIQVIEDFIFHTSDNRIKIHQSKHVGRAVALSLGVKMANFPWIAIIDADDLWHRNKLEIQVNYMQKFNLSFLGSKSKIFFETGQINLTDHIETSYNQDELKQVTLNRLLISNIISHSSVIIKKSLLNYNVNRRAQIDYEMWLNLLHNHHRLYVLPQALTFHRIHKDQSFESKQPLKYILSAAKLQLYFCLINFKFIQASLVIFKLGYYAVLPRKMRLLLREFFL